MKFHLKYVTVKLSLGCPQEYVIWMSTSGGGGGGGMLGQTNEWSFNINNHSNIFHCASSIDVKGLYLTKRHLFADRHLSVMSLYWLFLIIMDLTLPWLPYVACQLLPPGYCIHRYSNPASSSRLVFYFPTQSICEPCHMQHYVHAVIYFQDKSVS